MSIFNSSFPPEVQNELTLRQDNIYKRTNVLPLIQSTAWIRMTSGVNTLKEDIYKSNGDYESGDYSNNLAKANILTGILGGNKNPLGTTLKGYSSGNRHGIRPLPGIISMDCQSFTANGSLRKVSLKFNCWDNEQLNIMEKLYLRVGYLVCIEWGWSQKLSDGKKLTFPNFGDKFIDNNGEFQGKTLLELYQIANNEVKSVNGNYDICIGRVQNYNWQLRADNGYDCEVTIVTYGEILDSWKINNIDLSTSISTTGILIDNSDSKLDSLGISKYTEGKLCGILYDIDKWTANEYNSQPNSISGIDQGGSFKGTLLLNKGGLSVNTFAINLNNIEKQDNLLNGKVSTYITLESFCRVLNYYMLNEDIVKLSTFEVNTNEQLLCQSHPFQISCNPDICLIKPQGWMDGIATNNINKEKISKEPGIPIPKGMERNVYNLFNPNLEIKYKSFFQLLENELKNNTLDGSMFNIKQYIENSIDISKYETNSNGSLKLHFKNTNFTYDTIFKEEQSINLYDLLELNFDGTISYAVLNTGYKGIDKFKEQLKLFIKDNTKVKYRKLEGDKATFDIILKPNIKGYEESDIERFLKYEYNLSKNTLEALIPNELKQIQNSLNSRFKDMEPFFKDTDKTYRTGILGNIYLNINFLYSLIKPTQVTNDKNNKNEITLTNYIKDVLSQVQNSIGSLNAFEIYADPIDNVAKIIDKDFVESEKVEPYLINADTTKSNITALSFKSLVFPEQSTIVAISTQAPAGKYGYANRGLVDYNEGITNRFINIDSPYDKSNNNNFNVNVDQNNPLYLAVSHLSYYTSLLKVTSDKIKNDNINVNESSLNNMLRDSITYWDGKYKEGIYKSMPIPLTISLEFPGIAGIRIGNIFSIDGGSKDILPKSFNKEDMAFLVKSIGHTVEDNYWLTRIEGYPFKINKPNKNEILS